MSDIAEFTLDPRFIQRLGRGLSRPENVLGFRDGTVFTSSNRGYISRIDPGGTQTNFGRIPGDQPTTMALLADDSLLVNNTADGNLYKLDLDGHHSLYLSEIDGQPIGSANYVFRDFRDRIWIAVATRRKPPHAAIHVQPDGYIALIDEHGTRIVADGLYWPNEIRFDADQSHAFVPETFGRRLLRFDVSDRGDLSARRTWGPEIFSETSAPDGIALDADGNVWVSIVSRNGLVIVEPNQRTHTVFENPNREGLDPWLRSYYRGVIPVSEIQATKGDILQLPTSVGFCGPDLRTVVMGSLAMESLLTFESSIAGLPLVHQLRPTAPLPKTIESPDVE